MQAERALWASPRILTQTGLLTGAYIPATIQTDAYLCADDVILSHPGLVVLDTRVFHEPKICQLLPRTSLRQLLDLEPRIISAGACWATFRASDSHSIVAQSEGYIATPLAIHLPPSFLPPSLNPSKMSSSPKLKKIFGKVIEKIEEDTYRTRSIYFGQESF